MPRPSARLISLLASLAMISLLFGPARPAPRAHAAASLLGYWRFEEGSGTTAADDTGNGHTGTFVGAPVWSADLPPTSSSYALALDGDDAVQIANSPALETSSLTISAWIKPTWSGADHNPTLFSMRDPDGTYWSWHVRSDYSGVDLWTEEYLNTVATPITPGRWTHLGLVLDASSTSWSLYLDGVLQGSNVGAANASHTGQPFNIGFNGSGEPFFGLMDEVRLYAGVLSAEEIAPLAARSCDTSREVTSAADSGAGSLREALGKVCSGGTIIFGGDATIALQSPLVLAESLTIDGAGHTIVLSGTLAASTTGEGGIVQVAAGVSATIKDLTLTKGLAYAGGAIYNAGELTVEDSTLTKNETTTNGKGGAIFNTGVLKLTGTTLSANKAFIAGGIYNEGTATISASTLAENETMGGSAGALLNAGTMTVVESSIQNNGASAGGGFNNQGDLVVERSTIAGNEATEGGGILSGQGSLEVTSSTITGNSGSGGGAGIYVAGGTATISASTIAGNHASGAPGGGINIAGGSATISNTLITGNHAPYNDVTNGMGRGGGIASSGDLRVLNSTIAGNSSADGFGGIDNGGTLAVTNTIVWGNSGDELGGGTVTVGGSIVEGGLGGGLNQDPRFVDAEPFASAPSMAGDYHLQAGSAAIDGGESASCPASDLRGLARPQGAGCDMGAYEWPGLTLNVLGGSGQRTVVSTPFAAPLVVQLRQDGGQPLGAGHAITFSAPLAGASLSAPSFSATTDASGTVTATISANSTVGGYVVTVSADDVGGPALFALANCRPSLVVSSAADSGAGSLRQAIADVCDGGSITFAGDLSIVLASTLEIARPLTIDGSGHAVSLSGDTDGDNTPDVLVLNTSAHGVTLSGLTITEGRGGISNTGGLTVRGSTITNTAYGGASGISSAGSLAVVDSTLSGNQSSGIGAISASGPLTVTNSTFLSNGGMSAGGILLTAGANGSISGSTFANNSAMSTGAIALSGGASASIVSSTFSNNGGMSAGGISVGAAAGASISGSTFANNNGTSAGAIALAPDATANIVNSTFSGNSALSVGGVNVAPSATVGIVNSTFSGNNGQGASDIGNGGVLTLRNTILANQAGGASCANNGSLAANVGNLIEDGSCSPALTGDPLLGPLANNGGATQTFALLSGSPAIDGGESASCPATDQRGVARPQGSGCDIGAVEGFSYHTLLPLVQR